MQNIKILKREPKPVDDEQLSSASSNSVPTLEEREDMYMKAKARIFQPQSAQPITEEQPNERPPQKAEYRFKEDEVTDPE
jgi:SUZ domain